MTADLNYKSTVAFDFKDSYNDIYRIFFATSGVIQILNVTQDCFVNYNNPELKNGLFGNGFRINRISAEVIDYTKSLVKLKAFW